LLKGHENQVYKLKKALYKQAPRAWYSKLLKVDQGAKVDRCCLNNLWGVSCIL